MKENDGGAVEPFLEPSPKENDGAVKGFFCSEAESVSKEMEGAVPESFVSGFALPPNESPVVGVSFFSELAATPKENAGAVAGAPAVSGAAPLPNENAGAVVVSFFSDNAPLPKVKEGAVDVSFFPAAVLLPKENAGFSASLLEELAPLPKLKEIFGAEELAFGISADFDASGKALDVSIGLVPNEKEAFFFSLADVKANDGTGVILSFWSSLTSLVKRIAGLGSDLLLNVKEGLACL